MVEKLIMKAEFATAQAVHTRAMLPQPMPAGEEFPADERRFPTVMAARIAGIEAATFRSWGRKYGVLGWPELAEEYSNAGILWSVLDLLKLRLLAIMVSSGIYPSDACWRIGTEETPEKIVVGNVAMFVALINDPSLPSLMIFQAGGTAKNPTDRVTFTMVDPAQPVGRAYEAVRKLSHRPNMTLIDLRDIINDVERELAIKAVTK